MKKIWLIIVVMLSGSLVGNPISLVYHPEYNFSLGKWTDKVVGLVHPIDGCRYKKMKRLIDDQVNPSDVEWITPECALSDKELEAVHTSDYIRSLQDSNVLSHIIDLDDWLSWMPAKTMHDTIIMPQKWAAAGTILAAKLALEHGISINIGGGFHHAKADAGEGGCAIADIPLAIHALRKEREDLRTMVIDLDAHQGNGNASMLGDDPHVYLFDMHNKNVEPYEASLDSSIDCTVPLNGGELKENWGIIPWIEYPSGRRVDTKEYMGILKEKLPQAIQDAKKKMGEVDLIIYNAGSDIYNKDPWGCLNVSAEGIADRDQYVFECAEQNDIPIAMVLSGGYGKNNAKIVSKSIAQLVKTSYRSPLFGMSLE